MKKLSALALAMIALFTLSACGGEETVEGDTYLELNPYESVDWEADSHVLANLHTHTQTSDGDYTPAEVVDMYHDHGYGALAITDHDDDVNNSSYDRVAYPWSEFDQVNSKWENRDPADLGMIAIAGSELSYNHHIVALFTDYRASSGDEDEETAMQNAFDSEEDALAFMAHPGRYWEVDETFESGDKYSPEWYMDFFNTFDQDRLAGIEIFNRNMEYPDDRILWDTLLTESMPERPIWGFSNDDYHGFSPEDPGYSKTYHLVNDATSKDDFHASIVDGAFYAQYSRTAMDEGPTVASITVNESARTIEIEVDGDYERIRWLSGVDDDTNTSGYVSAGETFEYADYDGAYVRAEIVTNEGGFEEIQTVLQPFGFVQDPDREE